MTVLNGPGAAVLGGADRAIVVSAVKAQLRACIDDDDALIATLAQSALGVAEQFVGQVLIARELSVSVAPGDAWQVLPVAPVTAITAVSAAGTALPIADYGVDVDADGRGWIRVARRASVIARAGMSPEWADLPAAIRQGVVMLAAHLFEHRRGEAPVPAAVTALWRPYRRMALNRARRA